MKATLLNVGASLILLVTSLDMVLNFRPILFSFLLVLEVLVVTYIMTAEMGKIRFYRMVQS